jgi:hypothetical protein
MFRNLRITRSVSLSLVLACGLVVTGCGGPVAAQVTGSPASDAVAVAAIVGPGQHDVAMSDGRDPYASARDIGTGELIRDIGTGELFFTAAAAPLGPEQHVVVSSDGRDPYVSARDLGTGEFITDIATGESLR